MLQLQNFKTKESIKRYYRLDQNYETKKISTTVVIICTVMLHLLINRLLW